MLTVFESSAGSASPQYRAQCFLKFDYISAMKYRLLRERPLALSVFLLVAFAGCQKKAQDPHHFIKLRAEGNPAKTRFDSAVLVLDQRLKTAYEGDVTARAEGKDILLEVAGRPNLDSLAVLVLSKGGFGMYETYNNDEVTSGVDAQPDALGAGVAPPGGAVLIYTMASDTTRVRKQFVERNPSLYNVMFVWGPEDESRHLFPLYALKRPASGKPLVSKEMIDMARSDYDGMGRPSVTIRLKPAFFDAWSEITRNNIRRYIAVKFGNQVLYAPLVNSEIPGGMMQISGHFTRFQTTMFAAIIAAPDLVAPLQIVHVDTALFVPLQGYPTLRQQARYEIVQNEFLRMKPQIDSMVAGISSDQQRSFFTRETKRIYNQDINTIAAETHASKADVEAFIVRIEEVSNGLKRYFNGETNDAALKGLLETNPAQ